MYEGKTERDESAGPLPNLEGLSDEVTRLSQATRGFVEEYPLLSFGAVVLAGYFVGRMIRR